MQKHGSAELSGGVAPALRGVKGGHETSHKSALRSDWWRSSRTSLDSASLRGGFAGSKAKAPQGSAEALPAGGDFGGPRDPEGRLGCRS